MQTNIKRHLNLIYGLNSNGMQCFYKPEITKLIKLDLKRIKTSDGIERVFTNQNQSKLFLSKLQKRFFKRFRKPIFSKIQENGKKITYKVGTKI